MKRENANDLIQKIEQKFNDKGIKQIKKGTRKQFQKKQKNNNKPKKGNNE